MLLVGSSAVVEPFPGTATLMQNARGDPAAFEIVHKLPSSMGFYRCPLYAIHNIIYSPSVTINHPPHHRVVMIRSPPF